jgi:hypothetical protein
VVKAGVTSIVSEGLTANAAPHVPLETKNSADRIRPLTPFAGGEDTDTSHLV